MLRKTHGNEKFYHSYVGEATCGHFAMLCECYYLWGKEFTWLTDCWGLHWILSYDGPNHTIHCWLIEFSTFSFHVFHHHAHLMIEGDTLSHLHQPDPLCVQYTNDATHFKNFISPF